MTRFVAPEANDSGLPLVKFYLHVEYGKDSMGDEIDLVKEQDGVWRIYGGTSSELNQDYSGR